MRRILCSLGFHRWEAEAYRQGRVQPLGINGFLEAETIQEGSQRCRSCEIERMVYRKGILGAVAQCTRWRSASPRKLRYIRSLSGQRLVR
jgi:hypothetical protein